MHSQTILENGVRVVTKKMEQQRSLSIGFLFDAGPAHEPEFKSGVAHLCEHLMFKGTKGRSDDEIARIVDTTGGSIAAFTSRDYTCFSATVLDDYGTYIIDLFGDVFLNSVFRPASLEQEKHSIQHELLSASDRPDLLAHEQLKAAIWQGHHLGRPIGGSLASVERLEREDVLAFVDQHYRANRLVVAAAGNLIHDELVASINDALWALRPGRANVLPAGGLAPFQAGVQVSQKDIRHVYFSIGIRAFSFNSEHRYHLHLLNAILGGGISSRLYHCLRQTKGLVYAIDSEYQAYRDGGLLVIEGATLPELLEEVLVTIFTELNELACGGLSISAEELWKAKMQLKGRHLLAAENGSTIMSNLATQSLYFNRYIESEEMVSRIEDVEAGVLHGLASRLLQGGIKDAAISLVGPEGIGDCLAAVLQKMTSGV
ncbi:M16 family metallopeptidase [Desulfogranum mediterraneum]|uniref:M16 family metallopeptidase n=1 Tax=Desulfogranum mediterraneum TaxID=160661 RepID=UPI00041FA0BD|nr:pitrilysin family protein [Desulfogranum mediterraneum]